MMTTYKVEEIQTVFKVPLSYKHLKIKHIKLHNGLDAILISNPKAQNSTAAMCVKSGYFDDPSGLPGLAHLCEHMLFAGTKLFPGKSAYYSSVLKHGGYCNAYTLSDSTMFQFSVPTKSMHDEVQPEYYHLLKMFASQFICPLFSVSSIREEVNVVDQEHRANIGNMEKTFLHLLKYLATPDHPYKKFSTGNSETLSSQTDKVLKAHLKSYFKSNFCGNNMVLAIHSDQSLHTLQKLVVAEFSSISSGLDKWHLQILPKNIINTKKIMYVKYDTEPANFRLVFPINNSLVPPSFQRVWCDLLGSETNESLLYHLKKREWVTSIYAYLAKAYNGCNFVTIELCVTSKGINSPKLVSTIFAYLTKLPQFLTPKVLESYLKQCCTIEKLNFYLSDSLSDEAELTRTIAENIEQKFIHPENSIQGFNSMSDELRDWTLITRLFYQLTSKYLTLDNCNVLIFSASAIGRCLSIARKNVEYDKYFDINFEVSDLKIDTIKIDSNRLQNFEFEFLQPNSFMSISANQIDSLIGDLANTVRLAQTSITHDLPHMKNSNQPKLYEISNNKEVWVKLIEDNGYNLEHITFHYCKANMDRNPKNLISIKLLCKMIGANLYSKLYPSELLGYSWKIIPAINGTMSITVSISGQPLGVYRILKIIVDEIRLTMTNFGALGYSQIKGPRISLRKELEELENLDVLTKAIAVSLIFLEEGVWSASQQLHALEELEMQDIIDICEIFINSETYISSLIEIKAEKNVVDERIADICSLINKPVQSQNSNICLWSPSSHFVSSGLNLKADIGYICDKGANLVNYYIQMGIRDDMTTRTFSRILSKYLDSNAQIELRIKKNLGYQIYSGQRVYRKTVGLYIIVVSSSHSSAELIMGIDDFLLEMLTKVQEMSELQYQCNVIAPAIKKDTMAGTLGCGPINQNCELASTIGSSTTPSSEEYLTHTGEWEKIISRSYTFIGPNAEDDWDIEIVKSLSRKEFCAIFELRCSPLSKNRSVLLMHGDNARASTWSRESQNRKWSKFKFKTERKLITKLPYINTNLEEFHRMCSVVR